MKLKKGYKQTEVGVIPEDWEVQALQRSIDQLEAGVSVNSITTENESSGYEKMILKTSCVYSGLFNPNEAKPILLEDISRARLNPQKNTILISRMNTVELVGECGYVEEDLPNHFLPDRLWMTKFRKDSTVNVKWLAYLLSSPTYKKTIQDAATGTSGSMKNISKTSLLEIQIPHPPAKEQTAIATALGDMDNLIAGLEQLLEKKKAIKQGAMQELLSPTGPDGLPKKGWVVKRLGDDVKFQVGFPFPSVYFNQKGDGIRLIKNRDLKNDDQIFYFNNSYDDSFIVNDGDVLVSMDGEFILCLWGKGKALLNQRVGRIRKKREISPTFLFYYLQKPLKEIESKTSSTTVKHLSHSNIENLELPFPDFTIQNQIAKTLLDIDTDMEIHVRNLNKYKLIKQGMMQELLTGRKRLNPDLQDGRMTG